MDNKKFNRMFRDNMIEYEDLVVHGSELYDPNKELIFEIINFAHKDITVYINYISKKSKDKKPLRKALLYKRAKNSYEWLVSTNDSCRSYIWYCSILGISPSIYRLFADKIKAKYKKLFPIDNDKNLR